MQTEFQVSGSRTKLYSANAHSKNTSATPPPKISKLINLLKAPSISSEEEIILLNSFILENKDQKKFKQQYFRIVFYHILEHRLCQTEWMNKASYQHTLLCFQCVRLLARESSLLVNRNLNC